ncbi:UDP-glycosyltransferase [Ramlibacter sp. USB13]|uniref:UDP-glycosyltransferase n=1 Tax=Ramlibacter cellulosilyticus TaxID=2764187 RepID=A0A923MP51_9BURK|nr:UDP-glycosyltransferase [Ramlibacter cellulosilyticus]MBC5781994.1 UDP-glycosyltransferase [Ramlibacter cellulosilyticus]
MKALFVSYGGGHVEMCLPAMRALRERVPGCEARLLALTTAAGVARRAGEQPLAFRDFCTGPDAARALAFGEQLIGDQQHPDVTREESLAYLGLNFLEWVQALGEEGAWARWHARGRQGFRPVRLMTRILRELGSDVVVATNSPRSEQAAIEAAHALGIATLSMVDLFALPGDPYRERQVHADRITVLSEGTRRNLVEAGVDAARIVVTGNPAFDDLSGPQAQEAAARLRAERGWGERPVVLWAGHMEPEDADPRWAGAALGQAVQDLLLREVLARDDACLAIRYHPNEWHRFTPPAAHPRVHWSRPDREGLLPVLAAADVVVVQATTVGAQAHAAGKKLLGLSFSPLVQRSGMDYGRLGLGTGVPGLEALPALLAQQLAAVRRDAPAAGPRGGAAQRVAQEIAELAARPPGHRP